MLVPMTKVRILGPRSAVEAVVEPAPPARTRRARGCAHRAFTGWAGRCGEQSRPAARSSGLSWLRRTCCSATCRASRSRRVQRPRRGGRWISPGCENSSRVSPSTSRRPVGVWMRSATSGWCCPPISSRCGRCCRSCPSSQTSMQKGCGCSGWPRWRSCSTRMTSGSSKRSVSSWRSNSAPASSWSGPASSRARSDAWWCFRWIVGHRAGDARWLGAA